MTKAIKFSVAVFGSVCLLLFSLTGAAGGDFKGSHHVQYKQDKKDLPYAHPYPHPYPELWKTKYFESKGSEVFREPMLRHARLDFCYKFDSYCGRAAANAFCRSKGYNYATTFWIDRDVGETHNIANEGKRQYRHKHSGDGFSYIKCRS